MINQVCLWKLQMPIIALTAESHTLSPHWNGTKRSFRFRWISNQQASMNSVCFSPLTVKQLITESWKHCRLIDQVILTAIFLVGDRNLENTLLALRAWDVSFREQIMGWPGKGLASSHLGLGLICSCWLRLASEACQQWRHIQLTLFSLHFAIKTWRYVEKKAHTVGLVQQELLIWDKSIFS